MLPIKRWHKNPIIKPLPNLVWANRSTFNPGAVFDGEKVRMLFTAIGEDSHREMCLGYAESKDGFHFECVTEPFLDPAADDGEFDHGTVDDARITALDGAYYIVYAARAMSQRKWYMGERLKNVPNNHDTWVLNLRRAGLAVTRDWRSVERLGPITSEHLSDQNVVLFPEKIGGRYVMLHRPNSALPWYIHNKYNPGRIWIAFSDDLQTWGWEGIIRKSQPWTIGEQDLSDDHLLIGPEYEWESQKIGAAGTPIATERGWLMLYHAVDRQGIYRVGILLLDRENPRKVLARSPQPVMEAELPYEINGHYPRVIFPCAHVVIGDEVFIYYGATDDTCCVATIRLKDLLDYAWTCRIR